MACWCGARFWCGMRVMGGPSHLGRAEYANMKREDGWMDGWMRTMEGRKIKEAQDDGVMSMVDDAGVR
jgi:hypothetical protein